MRGNNAGGGGGGPQQYGGGGMVMQPGMRMPAMNMAAARSGMMGGGSAPGGYGTQGGGYGMPVGGGGMAGMGGGGQAPAQVPYESRDQNNPVTTKCIKSALYSQNYFKASFSTESLCPSAVNLVGHYEINP
jgi:hypothetical protein